MCSLQKMSSSLGLIALAIAVTSTFTTECIAQPAASGNPELRADLETTRSAVIAKIKAFNTWDASELWMVQLAAIQLKDAELESFVNGRLKDLGGDPLIRLFDSSRSPVELPATPGKGFERLMNFGLAPFGVPRERAIAWSAEFVSSKNYEGPVKTLQLLTLIYCDRLGLQLPAQLAGRRAEIADDLREDLARDTEFSYMFLQRLAILSAFESIPSEQKERCLSLLIGAQKAPADWGCPPPPPLTFDDDKLVPDCTERHILVLALVALTFA